MAKNKEKAKAKAKAKGKKASVKPSTSKSAITSTTSIIKPTSKEVAFYAGVLDAMDKKYNLSSGDYSPTYLSTNILSIDYAIGGGIRPGMITFSGVEMSAKSTLAIETVAASLAAKDRVSLIMYNDAENSLDATYAHNIAGRDIMSASAEAQIPIFYNSANVVEKLYDSLSFVMNRLPDKVFSQKLNGWFYRVEKDNKRHKEAVALLDQWATMDKTLSKGDYLYYQTENTAPQGLFINDSYASYAPDGVIEDEEVDNSVGLMARLYSKHIPRINGFIKRKALIVFGVNQIREKPMARFERPWYETGGNALKHYSNNRGIMTPRVVPEFWRGPKDRDLQHEKSVEFKDAEDAYAFKHYKNIKNKYGTPFRETFTRVWVSDGNKPLARGRGFDKVFDTFNVLADMGLAKASNSGKLGKVIVFEKDSPIFKGEKVEWLDFKAMVLYEISSDEFKTPYLEDNAKKAAKKYNLKHFNLRKKVAELVHL